MSDEAPDPGSRTRSTAGGPPEAAWRGPAARLSALLLPPALLARLPASGELAVVPAGSLTLLPFAALPLPSDPGEAPASLLGLRYAIRYAPSLQVLADLESRPVGVRPTSAPLVVSNPTMPRMPARDGSARPLPSLPAAEAEGEWVASRLRTTLLTGGRATESAVRARLGSATLVHLATHGSAYARDARSRDSFVALAPDTLQDGLLTVGEVLDGVGPMRAELVVLSACQTGLGNLKAAEGTVGLQRAFLAQGARGVLVTLWNVSDEATELLMQRFYTHWLEGATKAEALRRAQEAVAAHPRFGRPSFWAAYQLVGAR